MTAKAVYPQVNEVFEMTLDGNAPENQPLAMVERDCGSSKHWEHNGPVVEGVQIFECKLVGGVYCHGWNAVLAFNQQHGKAPLGQLKEAFKRQFPTPDGKGPVGFADASWTDPHVNVCFPYVDVDGSSDFGWTGIYFGENWRWLVLSK